MKKIIETIAPISLENLKIYFQDKNVLYKINYSKSELKDEKLFVYLSNLDLPCDLVFDSFDEVFSALKSYLHFSHILDIPILEIMTISLLKQVKGLASDGWPSEFIEENKEIINEWIKKLDSLTIYNVYIIDSEELKDYAKSYKENTTSTIEGINFVSVLKYPEFYDFYSKIDESNLEYYSYYFNEYVFKGDNLYKYWANENNPMFILTWGIASGELNVQDYIESIKIDERELIKDVPSSA